MNEQLTPDMQQHVEVLHRYICAMESGDIDTLTAVLSEAEQDHVLERMILEINEVYQHVDHTTVQPADVATVQQLLNAMPVMRAGSSMAPTSGRGQAPPLPGSGEARPSRTTVGAGLVPALHGAHHQAPKVLKPTTQVLPPRKIASQKWYHRRRNWMVAAVAAALIMLVLLPDSGALANQILSFFRVQYFQPVQVTKQDLTTLSSLPIPGLDDLGTVQI